MICYTNHTPVLEIKWPKASHGPMAFNLRNYIPNGYSFSETSKCGMRKNRQIIGRGPCAGLNCLSRFPAANCRARFTCVRLTHVYCSSAQKHMYIIGRGTFVLFIVHDSFTYLLATHEKEREELMIGRGKCLLS